MLFPKRVLRTSILKGERVHSRGRRKRNKKRSGVDGRWLHSCETWLVLLETAFYMWKERSQENYAFLCLGPGMISGLVFVQYLWRSAINLHCQDKSQQNSDFWLVFLGGVSILKDFRAHKEFFPEQLWGRPPRVLRGPSTLPPSTWEQKAGSFLHGSVPKLNF